MKAIRSGVIVIGGGVVKHHICNANLMVCIVNQQGYNYIYYIRKINVTKECISQRNGADFGVFLNTASEYDGSDSGASPDEAVSWGKIRKDSKAVKVAFLIDYIITLFS